MINGDTPTEIAKSIAEMQILLVHIFSDYVFEWPGEAAWSQDYFTAPKNVYCRSELAGEEVILDSRINHVISRSSWVVLGHGVNFVNTILRLPDDCTALARRPLKLWKLSLQLCINCQLGRRRLRNLCASFLPSNCYPNHNGRVSNTRQTPVEFLYGMQNDCEYIWNNKARFAHRFK